MNFVLRSLTEILGDVGHRASSGTMKLVPAGRQIFGKLIDGPVMCSGKRCVERGRIPAFGDTAGVATTLLFSTKRIAPVVEKVLRSAIQNANYVSQEQGLDVDVDNLYVKTAVANEGPRMKRIRPAPMGRAYRERRHYSHLTVVVSSERSGGKAAEAE